MAAAIWLEFLKEPTDAIWPISILIGASSSGILVLALAAIVDVVGENQVRFCFEFKLFNPLISSVLPYYLISRLVSYILFIAFVL